MTEKTTLAPPLSPTANLVAKTIEDGGKHHVAISLTFLLACLYVGITVASTTHRQLLLGGSLKLPILDVFIPLTGFYLVAPALILGLHMHLLLQNHVLVRRLQHKRLEELGGDEEYFLFPALPVLHKILQPKEAQVASLVWAGLWSLNILLPMAVLCLAQYFFLPYHSFWITLFHQVYIVIDLVIAWGFLVVHLPPREKGGNRWTLWKSFGIVCTALVLFYSFVLAVVPGTWIERLTGKHKLVGLVPRNLKLSGQLLISQMPSSELLAASELMGEDQELSFYRHAIGASLVGRDLRGAELEGATLFKADLRGADLTGAYLEGADLSGANLAPLDVKTPILTQDRSIQKIKDIEEELRKGRFRPTRLDDAHLKDAKFAGARLIMASFLRADLTRAHLTGVELTGAKLRRAKLREAELSGAELSHSRMELADLTGAHAEGATFDYAFLAGATLNNVQAPATSFVSASLEGARFANAVLKAADFRGAALAGSDFRMAFLQGATALALDRMDLRGAHLGGACGMKTLGWADLRSVEFTFLLPENWQGLRNDLITRLQEKFERESKVALDRIELASKRQQEPFAQVACLGTLLSDPVALGNLGLLYVDEGRSTIISSEPPASIVWNEAVFHEELAKQLLQEACANEGLAWSLTFRAAGEYVPGDRELDFVLARQLIEKLRDPNCVQLRDFPQHLKQLISWRLRKEERAANW